MLTHFHTALKQVTILIFCALSTFHIQAQENSIAQEWNEALLFAISRDFARPTVHARNLFHTSIASYDAWAAFDQSAEPYLLGRTRGTYTSIFNGISIPDSPEDLELARKTAISHACYTLIKHRFQSSPNAFETLNHINQLMDDLGMNRLNISTSYVNGGPAELGNYIGQQLINFGLTDGSNESGGYANQYYQPLNPNILPEEPGAGDVVDPNRWQAISLSVSIDQSGNVVSNPPFLSPEWGNVLPFSMTDANKTTLERDGHYWHVYFDPGPPPLLDTTDTSGIESLYKWNFCMVAVWQSHLDPDDDTMIDISPASIGNLQSYPTNHADYPAFYDFEDGGVPSPGYTINPVTDAPYAPQFIKRGDYTRILAEYWADGPNSATPPGHWFDIYNGLRHHALFENKWMGEGPELTSLEYDVKTYLTLGGAMHDAAITAWSIKGYYDYVRPVSAVRFMCDKGQCSDPDGMNYHPAGMPLMPGFIEQVQIGDPLAGDANENVGKIKLYTWKGPDYITDPETTYSGTGWILGENWWPYQRPTFVSPPFAGYISGHSTYSRTAAEVLTLTTGSAYFPGGMSNFIAEEGEFLEFEDGPSETIALQWATYRDASDQCSLSRIWGGIHPPADDIPGRLIGIELGPQAFGAANTLFETDRPVIESITTSKSVLNIDEIDTDFTATITYDRPMDIAIPPVITFLVNNPLGPAISVTDVEWTSNTTYEINYHIENSEVEMENIFMRVAGAKAEDGTVQNVFLEPRPFLVDTKRPLIAALNTNENLINDQSENSGFVINIIFNEACNTDITPELVFISDEDLAESLLFNVDLSGWLDDSHYEAHFNVVDNNEEIQDIGIQVNNVEDAAGNNLLDYEEPVVFNIDTRNPEIAELTVSNNLLNTANVGSQALLITLEFDEEMNTDVTPALSFPNENPLGEVLILNTFSSGWLNGFTYVTVYNQINSSVEMDEIVVELTNFNDLAGNNPTETSFSTLFSIDTKKPEVQNISVLSTVLADADVSSGIFEVDIVFEEEMNQSQLLLIQLVGSGISGSITYNPFNSEWINELTFKASFNTSDQNVEIDNIGIEIGFGLDLAGNSQIPYAIDEWISLDTKNPEIAVLLANEYTLSGSDIGSGSFSILAMFSEEMDQDQNPAFLFEASADVDQVLSLNTDLSGWLNGFSYQAYFDVAPVEISISDIQVTVNNAYDIPGNEVLPSVFTSYFSIDIISVGTLDNANDYGIEIYPNPLRSGSDLTIDVKNAHQNIICQIWSINGNLVYSENFTVLEQGKHMIAPSSLSDGTYFILFQNGNMRHSQKLVIVD